MFRRSPTASEARRHRRTVRALRDRLSPHLLRDIGLDPAPEPVRTTDPQLW